jgi:hypothetical protein
LVSCFQMFQNMIQLVSDAAPQPGTSASALPTDGDASTTSEAPSPPISPTSVADAPAADAAVTPPPTVALGARSKAAVARVGPAKMEAPSSPTSLADAPRAFGNAAASSADAAPARQRPQTLAAPPMYAAIATSASSVARVKKQTTQPQPAPRQEGAAFGAAALAGGP